MVRVSGSLSPEELIDDGVDERSDGSQVSGMSSMDGLAMGSKRVHLTARSLPSIIRRGGQGTCPTDG